MASILVLSSAACFIRPRKSAIASPSFTFAIAQIRRLRTSSASRRRAPKADSSSSSAGGSTPSHPPRRSRAAAAPHRDCGCRTATISAPGKPRQHVLHQRVGLHAPPEFLVPRVDLRLDARLPGRGRDHHHPAPAGQGGEPPRQIADERSSTRPAPARSRACRPRNGRDARSRSSAVLSCRSRLSPANAIRSAKRAKVGAVADDGWRQRPAAVAAAARRRFARAPGLCERPFLPARRRPLGERLARRGARRDGWPCRRGMRRQRATCAAPRRARGRPLRATADRPHRRSAPAPFRPPRSAAARP